MIRTREFCCPVEGLMVLQTVQVLALHLEVPQLPDNRAPISLNTHRSRPQALLGQHEKTTSQGDSEDSHMNEPLSSKWDIFFS
jgi:hypothetical protein